MFCHFLRFSGFFRGCREEEAKMKRVHREEEEEDLLRQAGRADERLRELKHVQRDQQYMELINP